MPTFRDHVMLERHNTYAAVCARQAVLYPLVQPLLRGAAPGDRNNSRVQYAKLISLWRKRVRVLNGVGKWSPIHNGNIAHRKVSFRSISNCPPFGVQLADYPYTCRRARICPMCYARQIVIGRTAAR